MHLCRYNVIHDDCAMYLCRYLCVYSTYRYKYLYSQCTCAGISVMYLRRYLVVYCTYMQCKQVPVCLMYLQMYLHRYNIPVPDDED